MLEPKLHLYHKMVLVFGLEFESVLVFEFELMYLLVLKLEFGFE